jgi:hypothetical protein
MCLNWQSRNGELSVKGIKKNMKKKKLYWIECIAAGFICLVLFCVPLFWVRYLSENILRVKQGFRNQSGIEIRPSGLMPESIENDPNVVYPSEIRGQMSMDFALTGFWYYYRDRMVEGRYSDIYKHSRSGYKIYFDVKGGLVNMTHNYKARLSDGTIEHRRMHLYAGPEGVSESPDTELGRFVEPMFDTATDDRHVLVLYDKKYKRFFKLDFGWRKVTKGPEVDKVLKFQPLQIGEIEKNDHEMYLDVDPPMIESFKMVLDEDSDKEREFKDWQPLAWLRHNDAGAYVLVLDESGIIYLLDKESLSISGTAGRLPACKTLYDSKTQVGPKDLLAYEVLPVSLWEDKKYRGMCAASLSREGTSMALAIYDEEGKLLRKVDSVMEGYEPELYYKPVSSSEKIYFHTAWAPTLTIIKYLGENLHPPVLSLISYFTAESLEAESGYQAMFFMPNSFAAMKGRQVDKGEISKFLDAFMLLMGPGIILSVILAWRVGRDTKAVGISEEGMMFWIAATVLLGLVGYITYRVVRYKERLVTCMNCGKMRRCDMEMCHRCGAGWDVLELAEPQWRVIR